MLEFRRRIQGFFNTAFLAHVIEGKPLGFTQAANGYVQCSYTKGCAIGVSLNESTLQVIRENEFMDTYSPLKLLTDERLHNIPYSEEHVPFLDMMQSAHDTAADLKYIDIYLNEEGTAKAKTLHNYPKKKSRKAIVESNYRKVAKWWDLEVPAY